MSTPICETTPSCEASFSASPAELTVQGLREQIFANAITLYPQLVSKSFQYCRTGVASPKEMFEIILTSSASDGGNYSYTAILVSGHALARSIAARGPKAACLVSALEGLLHVTSEALGWYTETLLGEIKNQEETDKGVVNFGMVEDGFHFAHVQRAMAVHAQV